MRTIHFAVTALLLFGVSVMAEPKQSLTEKQKIDVLINTVRQLKDATFVRNGSEYDCDAAAKHLRTKVDYAGDQIKTAKQFIDELATKSSQSGKLYIIKFKDGTEKPCGTFLSAKLDEIEHPAPTSQSAH